MPITLEQRRIYRENEVEKHGLFALNRKAQLRRALKQGFMSRVNMEKYQFTSRELPFLKEGEVAKLLSAFGKASLDDRSKAPSPHSSDMASLS